MARPNWRGRLLLGALCLAWPWAGDAQPVYQNCARFKGLVQREVNLWFGNSGSTPIIGALIYQESRCNPTARNPSDGGAGLTQLTGERNITWLGDQIGQDINPWVPSQAIKAGVWLLAFNFQRVEGKDECHRMGAALSAYNGGLGNVQESQRKSHWPSIWWGVTERYPTTRQSFDNFLHSRGYPHKVVWRHQPAFATWGKMTCVGSLTGEPQFFGR